MGPGEFNEILYGAVREGTRCLLDLQEKGKGDAPEGVTNALRNALALDSLRRRSPVSLTCEHKDFDWGEGVAKCLGRASVSHLDDDHPIVLLNPDLPRTAYADARVERMEVEKSRATLFHEHLHNLGHAHGEDIEYSSACEYCCFTIPGKCFSRKQSRWPAVCAPGTTANQSDPGS